MPERRFSILSTAPLPMEKIISIPESVDLLVLPFTQIEPRHNPAVKSRVEALASGVHTVIFTSAHAVRIVAGMLTRKPDWKIYCIRNETRIAVINWFDSASVVRFASNALTLSKYIIADAVQEAIFFCGDQRMDILPDNLRNHSVALEEVIVYDTRLTPVLVKNQPDALLFFSPTAVRSFYSVNTVSRTSRIFAMGKTTAETLKEYVTEEIIISPEADKIFVYNMAVQYALSHPII